MQSRRSTQSSAFGAVRTIRCHVSRALPFTVLTLGIACVSVLLGGAALAQTDSNSSSTTSSPTSVPSAPTSADASSTTVATTVSGASSSTTPSTTPATTQPTTPTTSTGSSTVAPTSLPPTVPPTTLKPGTIVIPPGKVLKVGSKGDDVKALEMRLAQLSIDTGKVDGKFDWSTWQGVVAFQKYWGLKRTGKVDDALRLKIQNSAELNGFIFSGPPTRLEVDKSKQLLFMFRGNKLWRVVSISSGSDKKYCEFSKKAQRQVCGTAHTPVGRFKIQRRISGWRESDLGRLYNPLYFNGGIAFHGAPSVPVYPASHGCVRLPMPVAEWFPDEVDNGTAVYVYE